MKRIVILIALFPLFACAQTVVVGSKPFTESYVLGEIAKRLLTEAGFEAEHKQGLGKTGIIWEALRTGNITFYPEYTGTISEAILKSKTPMTAEAMRNELQKLGIGMTEELGFNNTYALAVRRETAEKLGLKTISDLRRHPDLRVGLTHEFLDRADGWRPLSQRYGLNMPNVRGLEHALGYTALQSNQTDVKDVYSTDAKIAEMNLVALQDDLNYFPQYKAVFLYRLDAPPAALAAIRKLEGAINEERMIRLNAEAERTKNYPAAAALFFDQTGQTAPTASVGFSSELRGWLARHLYLVGLSLLFATLVGVPLGILAGRPGPLSQSILGVAGIIQTIPSLALLVVLIPLTGTSPTTAIVALFLYSLLPIVRNTATGLQDIPPGLRESAMALGLPPARRLTKIYLPIASRTILAGIKTSAVINVGTATLAALIGAGGLGEPIIRGLSLNDNNTILQGAIPAALLAIAVQVAFDLLDRAVIPKGLRLPRSA